MNDSSQKLPQTISQISQPKHISPIATPKKKFPGIKAQQSPKGTKGEANKTLDKTGDKTGD